MKKLFGKSKNAKEKEKRREEQKQENDFLYGRGVRDPAFGSSPQNLDPTPSKFGQNRNHRSDTGNDRNDLRSSDTSMNTGYYKGFSTNAVAPRENEDIGSTFGSNTTQYERREISYEAPTSMASGGKTSGMTQEDTDNPRIPSAMFEERLPAHAAHTYDEESEDDEPRKQSSHKRDHKDRKASHRKSDDRKDRKIKDSVPQDRDNGRSRYGNDEDSEQRRRKQREQSDQEKRMKDNIRQQRDAAKELRATARINKRNNGEDEAEKRRSKQREQSDQEKRLKDNIRQQRDAAKELRATAHINRQYDVDDEREQRRRRQREQSETDRKMKDNIRQQRDAAKELRASAHINKQYDVEDEREQRRRKQREQSDQDKRMKDTIRQQRDAAKELRASAQINRQYDVEDEREQYRKMRIGEESESDHHDAFENGLQLVGGYCKPAGKLSGQRETENPGVEQNLIDLHVAQFRATTKTTTLDDEEYDMFDEVDALEDFEEEEFRKNRRRTLTRRVSVTTMKINAWQQKFSLKKALELADRTPQQEWLSSFYRCDPRWNILKFFDEVAREGGEAPMDENLAASPLADLFHKANVFTVWRPTSDEAIKNMMLGKATGKGLDIKGKSAKKGNISSYVPFIQIYKDPHKEHVRALIKDGKFVRVFYQTEAARNEALEMMLDIKDFMLFAADDAMRVLSDEYADPAEQELAMKHLMYDDNNLDVKFVDMYINSSEPAYGLDITERLFWESYVMMQECSRPEGTEWDIGRNSELAFMDMNFKAIRHEPGPDDPRAVVYQMSKNSPMEPRMLLMAYEEYGRVKPVVSDFDCFLLGSRGVKYENPLPKEQLELLKWMIKNISDVLGERCDDSEAGWMETWFKVIKKAALKGYYPLQPKYGNGDPKSYEIMEIAVSRLQETGCVRHGAECFNWFMPQEIDDEFLVVSDTLPGNVNWKKVNPHELQDILITKIDEGFTFPLNPKWILCDPGWRRVYDKLLASQRPNVQDSIKCWLPPESGLREEIDVISARHPLGFEGIYEKPEGSEMMDQMNQDLERYLKIQRAWRKLRLVLYWIRFVREKRREREEKLVASA